jgi:hypothetical protein
LDAFHPASASVVCEGGFILEIFVHWGSLLGGMGGRRAIGWVLVYCTFKAKVFTFYL